MQRRRVLASIASALFLAAGAPPPKSSASPVADPLALDAATFEAELERRFQYGPPEPLPAEIPDPRAGQIADAAYFAAFPDYDRAYAPAERAEARRLAEHLKADAGSLTHEQFVLRVAEIAALADNGHTAIGENAFKKNTPRIPLRTYWFADGLYVLQATPEFSALLGARIDAIDGQPIGSVYQTIRRYQGGTDNHRRGKLIPMLESPALLQAAGIAHERGALTISGTLVGGAPFQRRIDAVERARDAWVSNTARLLFPEPAGSLPDNTISYMSAKDHLPVYLSDRKHVFSIAKLDHSGLYIGLAHNADADEGPIAGFLADALGRVAHDKPRFVVLDMRMNGGGDYTTTYGFAAALPNAVGPGGRIYVLTSPWTFSAAITTTGALKQFGGLRTIIVGEPVGDRLAFWAEGGRFVLPNAFVGVNYATGRHDYSHACTNTDECFWLNYFYVVRVPSLDPDIPAPLTFAAYKAGHDPALDAVYDRELKQQAATAKTP
jgi:hypothetical protein